MADNLLQTNIIPNLDVSTLGISPVDPHGLRCASLIGIPAVSAGAILPVDNLTQTQTIENIDLPGNGQVFVYFTQHGAQQ